MTFIPRPAQEQILTYTHGKMGISAVPGSGKTHTLSALAAQIIQSAQLAEEQEVLIVTLVNSAVDNFSSRIKEFLSLPMPFGYRIRTLHGLAHDIVREKPGAVGLENNFNILDERESDFIRKEAAQAWIHGHRDVLEDYLLPDLEESRRDWVHRQQLPEMVNGIALAFIRSAKDLRLTPEVLRNLLDQAPSPLQLAEMGWEIYSNYQRGLAYRGGVDFDDLIRLALDLLENDREYLERLRYRWPFILEDEAQDSSRLQEQILRLLSGEQGNWIRVGDPNQAIFETFTTASPQHLIDFIHEKTVKNYELPDSGRSQPSIITLANHLIEWVNSAALDPILQGALTSPRIQPAPAGDPQPNPPDDPHGIKLIGRKYTPDEELDAVGKSLAKWLPENPNATVAVLVPRNARGVEMIDVLKERDLPYVEFLNSTSSTRLAAGRMAELVGALADPQSPTRLSRAYLAWRRGDEETENERQKDVASLLGRCREVELFISPRGEKDWLKDLQKDGLPVEMLADLEAYRTMVRRWHGTTTLPIDQMILTLAQDLFTAPNDLALAHKLALVLRQIALEHPDWRLPELNNELNLVARNERRFIGFSEDDSGFDPNRHAGKVVVTTMHKAKGLEWDRVYLMSVNNLDFPSGIPTDRYISEKWFLRPGLNLEAEALAQLEAARSTGEYEYYSEGSATQAARRDYVRERLRLLYVGVTRAKKELIITWNAGRQGELNQAVAFAALQEWWENSH
jgi:DNA helicase-2/ATP-dependent DNA helicase PcrA